MLTATGTRRFLERLASPLRSRFLRYSLAVLNTALAALVLWPLRSSLPTGFSPPLLLAVVASAMLGGVGPGLVALALTALIANMWFYPPFGHVSTESAVDAMRQLIYITSGIPIACLGGALRQARARAEAEKAALRESEAHLLASDERYRAFLEQTAEGVWRFELEASVAVTAPEDEQIEHFYAYAYLAECNEVTARMYGFAHAEELLGARLVDFLPRNDPHNVEYLRAFVRSGYRLIDAESHEVDRNGASRYFLNNLIGIVQDGRLCRAWGSQRDITERKEAEAALQRSEARLRRVLDSEMIGIAFWNGTQVTDANDALLRLLGYDRNDLARGVLRHGALTPPEYEVADHQAADEVTARGVCTPYEKEFFRKDGTRVPVLVGGAVLDGDRRDGVFFVLDLTERQRTVEQLQAARRLETVGRLAGGIAHEANNQMAVVLGAAEFLLRRNDLPTEARQDVEQIRQAADHTAAITRQLLAFSRQQVLQPRPIDLNAELRSLESIVQRTLGADAALTFHLTPDLGLVRVDPAQLTQVILNLVLNARDAMSDGGTLTIGTAPARSEEVAELAPDEGDAPDDYVILTVTDTGHGMDHETLSRIFEPFYTTKPVGEGAGLGLATVHGVVRQSGGYISATSEPGRGTTFKIYLPQAERRGEPTEPSAPEVATAERTGETILVVDDQDKVRSMLVRLLEEEGYVVVEASSGSEALVAIEHDNTPLDLVITDLAMPQMSGGELARRLARTRPGVPVLFTSGHADQEMHRQGLLEAGQPFLQKPYSVDVLIAQVQQLLSERRQQAEQH